MATDLDFVEFVVDQVDPSCEIAYRKMFGEYALYSRGKVVALMCDNRLFVKPTEAGRSFIDVVVEAAPYPGAKPAFLIDERIEDREWLSELIEITEKALPSPKPKTKKKTRKGYGKMNLGTFSISLAVKDIKASKAFYEKLGFELFGGDIAQNWVILKNGDRIIGLFQGMFERNTLTFNPGWNSKAEQLDRFTDVRELQKKLKRLGVELVSEADESTTGPASFVVVDPDGNPILVDQHV